MTLNPASLGRLAVRAAERLSEIAAILRGRAVVVSIMAGLLCLSQLPGSPALSQGTDRDAIETKFREVAALRAEGKHDEAVVILENMIRDCADVDGVLKEAYAWLVSAHLSMDDAFAAEVAATEALKRFPAISPNPDYVGSSVVDLFDEVRKRMLGTVIVTTKPDSCQIVLDDAARGLSPLWLEYVESGEHVIRAHRAGYHDTVDSVRVEAGRKTGLHYSLEKIAVSNEPSFRTGVGAGIGFSFPHGDASTFADPGFTIGAGGWVSTKVLPSIVFKTDIQGIFSGEVSGGTFGTPDSSASYTYETVVAKIAPKIEIYGRYGAFEPYIGGGGGPYFIWTLTDIDEHVRGMDRTGTQVIHEMAWGLCGSMGVTIYLTRGFGLDFNVQYDYVPGVKTVGPGREQIRYPFRTLTFLLGVNFGRKPN
jgi:hypothetical protein